MTRTITSRTRRFFTGSTPVTFGRAAVGGRDIAYREAGDPSLRKLVLLHGFLSSAHQDRDLIAALAGRFQVIVPNDPGYGDKMVRSRNEPASLQIGPEA